MINAFYSAKSGAKNYQSFLNATANNISNVNTQSYKAQRVSFTDLIYSNFNGENEPENLQQGNGSRIVVTRDMSQGSMINGNGSLDVMINGNGFFALQKEDGSIAYSRNGSLKISQLDGENYLVSSSGDFVLDENLNRITVDSGDITLTAASENTQGVAVGLFEFENPGSLVATGDGSYVMPQDQVINVKADTDSKLVQNSLEGSNVELIKEMADMMIAQRGFQMNSQMIKTADEMEQQANSLIN